MDMASSDVQNVDLVVNQGDCGTWLFTFNDSISGNAVDITGWTFNSEIRELYDSTSVLATMTFDMTGLDSNQVIMSLSAAPTKSLPIPDATSPGYFRVNKFTYDVKVTVEDGCIYSVQRGTVYLNPTVTKI